MAFFNKFKRRRKNQHKSEAVQIQNSDALVTSNRTTVVDSTTAVNNVASETITSSNVESADIVAYKVDDAISGSVAVDEVNYDIIESEDGKQYVVNEKGVWIRHVADVDVTSISPTDMTFPSGTSDPASPSDGQVYFHTTENTLKIYSQSTNTWGSVVFSPLGSQQNPAPSAAAILADDPNASDGVYYIETASGVVATYCMMSWGGYMLAMKINNSFDNNFRYDGSYWSTSSPINESSFSSTGSADAVSRLYYEYQMTDRMRVSLNTFANYIDETNGISGRTLKQCMTGSYTASARSRADFLNWIAGAGTAASNWDNQPNCNTRGFQVSVSSGNCRWGISMNNEGDCSSNDSSVGLGCHTNSYYGNRTTNAGGSRWNPDQAWHYNAWVWIK